MYSDNLNLEHFAKAITAQTGGIVWLTDEELSINSPGVFEFNYLLDGVILKSLNQKNQNRNQHFFLGENFGKAIFIGHTVFKNKDDLKKINDHFNIASSMLLENSSIFIFNKSRNTANINILK